MDICQVYSTCKSSHITGIKSKTGKEIEVFYCVPLTSRQILTLPVNKVLKKIIKACKLAEELGKDCRFGALPLLLLIKGLALPGSGYPGYYREQLYSGNSH